MSQCRVLPASESSYGPRPPSRRAAAVTDHGAVQCEIAALAFPLQPHSRRDVTAARVPRAHHQALAFATQIMK
jgi:hypothetical protein